MPFSLTYETAKYVKIKDSRLAILRSLLLLVIVAYVGVFEMWGQGGWLQPLPVVGVVRFSLQQPTLENCDPTNDRSCRNNFQPLTELPYCEQAQMHGMTYPGKVYPCEIYEATNAQIVSEKSIAIITRASTRVEELVCGNSDMVCRRTYNATGEENKFYTAQSEAFTILFDHTVTESKICSTKNNYACSSESSKFAGRLLSKNANLCMQEFTRNNAFADPRGKTPKSEAPCFINPNRTRDDHDFFSLDVLLKAVSVGLDDCSNGNTDLTPRTDLPCLTYRDSGATLVLNIYWADFQKFRGMVKPFYYYAPQFLPGSSFKQSIPFYHSYRSSRVLLKAHGIRVAVLLGGEYHQFNIVMFLITLTTALGLLAVATTIVDTLMLYILPEKDRYHHAKYDEENPELVRSALNYALLSNDDDDVYQQDLSNDAMQGVVHIGQGQQYSNEPILSTST